MRIFLDANILFSAAKSHGAVHALVELLLKGGHECVVDAYVIAEARRNIEIKYAERLGSLEALIRILLRYDQKARAVAIPPDIKLVDKDRPVLAAAIGLGCDVLVTGDRKHFGALYGQRIAGVLIHSPRSLAEVLLMG